MTEIEDPIAEEFSKDYKIFILDSMRFSFSSVNAYNTCPRMFRLTYLDGDKVRQPNAFSDFGSFCHSLLEAYYKGDLPVWDLVTVYRDNYYEAVTSPFPPSRNNVMAENYYNAGEKYFREFSDPWKDYKVLGVEEKFQKAIEGVSFVGIIDLILQDKTTGEIYIVDHKSKSKFKSQAELSEYLRQLYLYSLYVKEKYGTYPAKLIFNMFRFEEIVESPFQEDGLRETLQWFGGIVKSIYEDAVYLPKKQAFNKSGEVAQDFFCNNICSVRKYCSRSIWFQE